MPHPSTSHLSSRRSPLNFVPAAISLLILGAATIANADDAMPSETLSELITKVRTAEALYQNIDVKYHFEMVAADVDPALIAFRRAVQHVPPKHNRLGSGRVVYEEWTARYVTQGSLYRLERQGYNVTDSDTLPRASRDLVDAWDGE